VLKERKYAMPNNKRLMTKIIKNKLKILKYSNFSDIKKLGVILLVILVIENIENDLSGQKRMGFSTLIEVFSSIRGK
jgi:hypothetical protein